MVGGSFWFLQQRRLAAEQVDGPRVQGEMTLRTRYRAITRASSPHPWMQYLYSLIGYEWDHRGVPYSLEITTRAPVVMLPGGMVVGSNIVLPIIDYTAVATTPNGKKFPLQVGLVPFVRRPIPQTQQTAGPLQSRVFYVTLPEKVPSTVDYLDVTLTGKGKTATWRVKDLPKFAQQFAPPAQPTAIIRKDGITMQAVAYFQPEGRAIQTWVHKSNIVARGGRFTKTNPPVPGATLQTQYLEPDIIKAACWMNYTRVVQSPSLVPNVANGMPLVVASPSFDWQNPDLEIEEILTEWGNGPAAIQGISSSVRLKGQGTGSPTLLPLESSTKLQTSSRAFGGEQQWARITGWLNTYQNVTVPIVFKEVPVKQAAQEWRLNIDEDSRTMTSEGVTVTLSDWDDPRNDPPRQGQHPRQGGIFPSPVAGMNSASTMTVRFDWSIADAVDSKRKKSLITGTGALRIRHSPFFKTLWQDTDGKWHEIRNSTAPFVFPNNSGAFQITIPRPTGKRIRALGIQVKLRRLTKSEPFVFTVPIQSGLPANLP